MESNIQNFFPPDALIKLIPQMGVVNLTTNYTDYVDQLPTPNLPYEGVTDKKVIEEIKSLQSTAIDHLAIAKDHANQFFSNVRPEVLDAYDDLLHFSIGTDVNYDYNFISLHYNDPAKQKTVLKALNMIKSTADRYLGDVKNAIAGVSTFNQNLSQDHAQFKKDYEEVKKDISDVSNIVTEIENKITALQAKIGDNNQKVAETAIEEGLDLVENGITLASDIADENVGDAIKTGAVLAYKFIKADITIILMEVEIIKLIREISALQQQLTLVENDLVILNNLGSIFSSLSDGGDFSFATLDGLSNYWEGLSAYMESLINGIGHGPTVNMVDSAIILKSWKETVHDVLSPFVDPDIVPPMPSIYQEGKNVKFDSLDNIGKYK